MYDDTSTKGATPMNKVDYNWIEKAVDTIKSGFVKRLDNESKTIKVYECGTVIRIDIKI